MTVKLIWATPNPDSIIAYCARVSNPANQDSENIAKLLKYCAVEGHWSVFEMASMCVEINTTRDIGRQILRHRSFSFQEFSQRYAAVDALPNVTPRACRLQDTKNRQNSLETDDALLAEWWESAQRAQVRESLALYKSALQRGIAKEQARALLPEGLTPSRMYVTGTLRSWITYLNVRLDQSTQKEHRLIAEEVLQVLREVAPVTIGAFFGDDDGK